MNALQKISWHNINASLSTLTETAGGYTTARRGIITLSNKEKLFVKIGLDGPTRQWAHKEVQTYRFLQRHNFPYIPMLIAVNKDETAFALEALQSGWDWSDNWTTERLDKTLQAMDDLAAINPEGDEGLLFEKSFISETADGWHPLLKNEASQQLLRAKLLTTGRPDIAEGLNFERHAKRSSPFVFERTALVHNDVRADNCAWNKELQTVRLIDWNWAQLGDRRIDTGAFLVHVYGTGYDITGYLNLLDKEALHWLAGFWLNAAVQPLPESSSEQAALRDYQLTSGVIAFDLAQNL